MPLQHLAGRIELPDPVRAPTKAADPHHLKLYFLEFACGTLLELRNSDKKITTKIFSGSFFFNFFFQFFEKKTAEQKTKIVHISLSVLQ